MAGGLTILVADDDKEVREYLEVAFQCAGCRVELAEDGQEVIARLEDRAADFGAVVLDLMMPRRDGLWALREIRKIDKGLPLFVLSAGPSPSNIVEAIKAGASDFIEKPVRSEDLLKIIRGARRPSTVLAQTDNGRSDSRSVVYFGNSPAMRGVRALLRQIGDSIAPVLIQGETGSGKEILARQLHQVSPRASQPFLKLNCAALPSELVESELFGYERGAFTGAFQRKAGMFELADRGTILLDEIGDMDIRLQAKLLQVLQDKEVRRLGGRETVHVDVRFMAATHRDLERAIRDETFREDLYYRLNIVNAVLPPLRERKEDMIGLAECFLEKYSPPGSPLLELPPNLQQAMIAYGWPGNIRELENVMRRYLIFRDPESLAYELRTKASPRSPSTVTSITAIASGASASVPSGYAGDISPLHEVSKARDKAESETILNALNASQWNRKRAAKILNVDYKALLYKMKKLSLGDKLVSSSSAAD